MRLPNSIGKKRFWTQERVLAALVRAAQEIEGPLPCSDRAWYKVKKGRFDWPSAIRILEYFGSMARAWLAADAPRRRVSLKNIDWTPEEDDYLKEHAGEKLLRAIAKHLGRTYPAVRKRLQKFGIEARHNQGYLSAAELSEYFDCPCHRVRRALNDGLIEGSFDAKRSRWKVDLAQLTPMAREILTRPKRTWKTRPTDHGDYEHRYGIVRKVIDGKVKRIKSCAAA